MSVRKWLVMAGLVAAASVSAPSSASADWIFTPFVGWNFKGAADIAGNGGAALHDAAVDALNERLMSSVNATGEIFLSHTRIGGALALRLAIGNLRTTEDHIARAWALLREHTAALARPVV